MDDLLYLGLEAHNPERNHHRRYEVRLGRDLFGQWVVTIGYGRSGSGGQRLVYSDASPEVVRDVIRYYLGRRASAHRRIGCDYRVRELSTADGIRPEEWLPPGYCPASREGSSDDASGGQFTEHFAEPDHSHTALSAQERGGDEA